MPPTPLRGPSSGLRLESVPLPPWQFSMPATPINTKFYKPKNREVSIRGSFVGDLIHMDLKQEFDSWVLEWARLQFANEINSDFRRSQQFNSPRTKEQLAVLRRQPARLLPVLARVLPLRV